MEGETFGRAHIHFNFKPLGPRLANVVICAEGTIDADAAAQLETR